MKEQIESLATFICDTCRERTKCENTTPCAMAEIVAKAIIKAGWCKQSEWISVEDRLPKQWETVLVFCDGIRSTDFISSTGRWYEHIDHDSVTHWMPLPNPPKGEDDEKQKMS